MGPLKKILTVLRWVLTAFAVLIAVVFLPSVTSALLLLFALLCAPLPRLTALWTGRLRIRASFRTGAAAALILTAIVFSPSAPARTAQRAPNPAPSQALAQAPAPTTEPAQAPVRAAPAPSPAPERVPTQTPHSSPAPAATPAPETARPQSRTVFVTKTGKRYHYSSTCNGGTYYASTLDEALARGLTPCKKCVG